MKTGLLLFFLATSLSGSLALRIIVSPEEADKILKKEDKFSEGLNGFTSKKESKVEKVKRLLINALHGNEKDAKVSVEVKKDAAPPGLPLDVKSKREDDMKSLEMLVDKLVAEVGAKKKRGCASFKCMTNYGREAEHAAETKETTNDELDYIYQTVKQLADPRSKKSASDSENIISDAGDRMLAKVHNMIEDKKSGSKRSETDQKAVLEKRVDKLLRMLSENSKKEVGSSAGEAVLTSVKDLIAKRQGSKAKKVTGVKDQITSIKKELSSLLNKLNDNKANEVAKEDVAVEMKASGNKKDARREMIVKLLKTYDAAKKRSTSKNSDLYASELESASRTIKRDVSKQTAKLIAGFDVDTKAHPK